MLLRAAAAPASVAVVDVTVEEDLINQGRGLGLRLRANSTKCETELLKAFFNEPNVHAALPVLAALALVLGEVGLDIVVAVVLVVD